ncbi:hypothetical protein [Streptomyces sp. NPDC056938]|uniref:hypothetical protein n=1 Tax=unclassified Streptomyces TaxID=2593676 RepID=UPI00362EA75A
MTIAAAAQVLRRGMTAFRTGQDTAMTEALYGLLGALGGALITGAAAYWGPLQMQRRAFAAERERDETARREAEAARREEQLRAASAEQASQFQAQREAETTRIIKMRTTTRAWSDFLARSIQDLGLGRPVDVERFDEQALATRNDAHSALDHALHDGIWIWQSSYGWPPQQHGAPLQHWVPPAHSPEQLRVRTALARVTELTREAVIKGEQLDTEGVAALRNALDKADEARGALNAALFNRLEEVIGVTAIGEPYGSLLASPNPPAAPDSHDETAASQASDADADE